MKITHEEYLKYKSLVDQYESDGSLNKYLSENRVGNDRIRVIDSDLPVRVISGLRAADLDTIGEVRDFIKSKGVSGLLKYRGFGPHSVECIRIHLEMTHEDFYKR